MCSSEELIHDARQITLEEMIMTNETPMYLVPGRLTNEQHDIFHDAIREAGHDAAIATIGTPIQPCADVETVGYEDESDDTGPLVRRTDMEAQVARVAAEKDAEIARVSDALKKMTAIATSRASEETVETMVRERTENLRGAIANAAVDLVEGVDSTSVCRNLRAALNEGAAG
ncbi:hypothetical protein LV478_11590 [Komagataeibacter oboediens]|uniref:hypothetical protein n=1 Tax=Komagataeibacter oboediens TaxID=65958 RepID=UPI0023DC9EA1|nr:hypothetical protein [Komagataeibacter oboediens]WEQ51172.1 hypothetical protein LV478_11590 [Komagataeibacter oboediens]